MKGALDAATATWPPAATRAVGGVTLCDGAGGGQRVSAARAGPGWTEGDLDRAIAAMADPLFQVADDPVLDAALARRGFVIHDPVAVMAAALAGLPPPALPVRRMWPPDGDVAALWVAEGIGPARLAVMHRAPAPKAVLATGCAAAFVACHVGWVVLHALAVAAGHRRGGVGRAVTLAAVAFGREHGAAGLAVLVTTANLPARQLYAALGLTDVGHYHYRRLPRAPGP